MRQIQINQLENIKQVAKRLPLLMLAGSSVFSIYTLLNDFYLNNVDLQDGAPPRALPQLQPLLLLDPATNSYVVNQAKVDSLLTNPRYQADTLEHHLEGIQMFANGEDRGFDYFYHGINEYTDGRHHLIYELFALPPARFSRFLEMAAAEEARVPSTYFEPGTLERLESRYAIEHAGEALAIYSLGYDLERFDDNGYLSMILNEATILEEDLDSFANSTGETEEEQSIIFQLGLLKNFVNLSRIRGSIVYDQSSAAQQQYLFTWNVEPQIEYLAGVFGNVLGPAMIDLSLRELDEIAYQRFGVNSLQALPIFATLRAQIDQQNNANYAYWESLLTDVGLETERANELLDVELIRDERWDTSGSAANNNLNVDDVDPVQEGIQAAQRTLIHEISHMLEPDIETLREFTREMTVCAQGDYEAEYPEFSAWCREVLYAGADLDKVTSYVGLANLFTDAEWNSFLNGETDELITRYFTVTIDAPSEMFAVTMDTIWAHFDEQEIPPRIREIAAQIVDLDKLNIHGDRSHGLKWPVSYLVMFIATKLILWGARKSKQFAQKRAQRADQEADTNIPRS